MLILRIIYNLLIFIALPVVLPVGYIFAAKRGEDRYYFERFGVIFLPDAPERSVWFHCASVGEVRSLARLVQVISEKDPELKIIISTTSFTGRCVAQEELEPYAVFLLPVENSLAVKHIISSMNVRALFIVDTEIWPNLILSASKLTDLYLINGRISDKSFGSYKKLRFITSKLLNKFRAIYAKSSEDAERFRLLAGQEQEIVPLGNIKFYKPDTDVEKPEVFEGKRIFTAASTHRGEEELACSAFKKCRDGFDLMLLAPRHMHRVTDAVRACEGAGLSCCLFSEEYNGADVIIIDVFGKLEAAYSASERIFIGGSVANIGGHNIFEALQFEKDVAVGPHMQNFQDIYDAALTHNAVTTINSETELVQFMTEGSFERDFGGFFEELSEASSDRLETIANIAVSKG